ncbi:MAG TPA: right-handed parallel beta-helix repeat-containing protein [Chthoniobacteraceae bacterium]|nr:right-handed parallel beta-helix repeat-containing protein [Chthoniobacteraceae bacterium]
MSIHLLPMVTFLFAAACAQGAVIELKHDSSVASLAQARDAARKLRETGDSGVITVRIADGTYELKEAVVFESRDSGVTYEAAPGAKPVFVGGRRISGFRAGGDGVWTTQLPLVAEGKEYFESLWVNGRRAIRARTPNEGYFQGLNGNPKPIEGLSSTGEANRTLIQLAPEEAKVIQGLSGRELLDVNALIYHSWDVDRRRIIGARITDGTLQFTGSGIRPFFYHEQYQRMHLENFRGALDAPGEWFLARDGTLSYVPRPGETPEMEAWIPTATQWLVFKGDASKGDYVKDLRFRGLAFRYQGYELPEDGAAFGQAENGLGAAIEANGAKSISFEKCEFAHTLTNAAWFRRGCSEVSLRDCLLHDLGAGGVKIGDQNTSAAGPDHTSHVTINNCIIHSGGRSFMAGIGVTIFHASDCVIRHCDIADFFYTAISIGWTWGYTPTVAGRNLVEHCHMHHLGWGVLSDMAAVYTLGAQPGTAIRGCHIHEISAASYGGWGMYNDEGSTGVLWENNLVHHTQHAGYHMHYGRGDIVRNNIIAFCGEEHVRRSRPEELFAFAFERNIVLLGDGALFAHVNKNWHDGRTDLHDNVYWKPFGSITAFAGKTWAEWQAMGQDTNSRVADPLFVDAAAGDWRLRPESPALALGFVPFDWKLAGVTGDEVWRQRAATVFPAMNTAGKPKVRFSLHDGFEKTPIGGRPMKAALGAKLPITVTADTASQGDRCLEITDGPEIAPAFDPHFYYSPGYESGTASVSFDVRLEPGFHFLHEWRDDTEPYRTGPMLSIQNGIVSSNGKKLTDIPPKGWAHVEIIAMLGDLSDGTWTCIITTHGRDPQRFEGLKFVSPQMKRLTWLGFISPGRERAKAWLDEVKVENAP